VDIYLHTKVSETNTFSVSPHNYFNMADEHNEREARLPFSLIGDESLNLIARTVNMSYRPYGGHRHQRSSLLGDVFITNQRVVFVKNTPHQRLSHLEDIFHIPLSHIEDEKIVLGDDTDKHYIRFSVGQGGPLPHIINGGVYKFAFSPQFMTCAMVMLKLLKLLCIVRFGKDFRQKLKHSSEASNKDSGGSAEPICTNRSEGGAGVDNLSPPSSSLECPPSPSPLLTPLAPSSASGNAPLERLTLGDTAVSSQSAETPAKSSPSFTSCSSSKVQPHSQRVLNVDDKRVRIAFYNPDTNEIYLTEEILDSDAASQLPRPTSKAYCDKDLKRAVRKIREMKLLCRNSQVQVVELGRISHLLPSGRT